MAFCAGLLIVSCADLARAQEPRKLSLKETVTLAVRNSRDVALASAQYTVAKAAVGVDRSVFRPNLYTGSGAAYTYGFPTTPGGGPPALFNLSYTESIYNAPARGETRAAEDRAEGKRFDMEKTRDMVMVNAACDYLELAKIRHSLDLLRTEQSSEQQIRDVTQERVASGFELPVESTRADLALARINQRMIQLEGREDALSDALHDATGIPSSQPIAVSPEDLPAATEISSEDAVSQAIQYSPDVKQAQTERDAQTDILRGDRGGYWPTVDLVGTYNLLSRINNYAQYYNFFQRNNVNVGIQLTIPIFSARAHAIVHWDTTQLAAANLAQAAKRTAVGRDAKQRIREVREANAAREVARLDLKLTQEDLGNAQSRYDQGHATIRDLEQARVDENEKWLAFLDSDFASQKAQLSLWQSTGELAQHLQ
jgi:outer membrane protein TolC